MSFEKARHIIDIYLDVASLHMGVTINKVMDDYGVSKRTAQRLLHTLEEMFDVDTWVDDYGRKYWQAKNHIRKELIDITAEELSSLDMAREYLAGQGQEVAVEQLTMLKRKVQALIPSKRSYAVGADYEALLEAQGYATRRGPRPKIDPQLMQNIHTAIKACQYMSIQYRKRGSLEVSMRKVAVYGLLYGKRPYLVAHTMDDPATMRYFRMDKIEASALEEDYFTRDPAFNIQDFSMKAYAIFQNDQEFGPVEWRFGPEAAEEAKTYIFHPRQEMVENPDGSLTVRFEASGYLEMCWDLYPWGDKVRVIKPKALAELVHPFARGDFKALP